MMRRVTVVVAASGALLANARVAERPLERAVGLLGSAGLGPDEGLVLQPCRSIHTMFMRFPIDVAFVDRRGRILRTYERLPAWRLVVGGRAAAVAIELASGTLRDRRVSVGAVLTFSPEL